MAPRVSFDPPLLNTSSAFSSTLEQLTALYHSPSTGAVTTRTALLNEGYKETPELHRHIFFQAPLSDPLVAVPGEDAKLDATPVSAINTYGYSKYALSYYLSALELLVPKHASQKKPFIISVAGTPEEVAEAVARISRFTTEKHLQVLVELNLSCPNISGTAPAGYSPESIHAYIEALPSDRSVVPIGLKVPPFTYAEQMRDVVRALEARPGAISFLTATNTLGNVLYAPPGKSTYAQHSVSLAPYLYGAMSGAMIHPLALGNVFSLRNLLDESPLELVKEVAIIGAGGVTDHAGFTRMREVGASAVGVATVLGYRGVAALDNILSPI
ncbi:hypothetical protein BKA62DRAFT_179036 [Auriculariales sp. MPI-PUGE-AT-0066]|nr:hypothetical protein BKA62DRAFT_179036 [Auriculariales sp. MPI-PUGE-AT-0066]